MVDEKIIIKECLNGNHKAFAILVDKYKSFVCSIAYCTIGNIDASEDIAQEVFLNVWKNLSSLKDHKKLKAWLSTITRNTVSHYIKKAQTVPKAIGSNIELVKFKHQPKGEQVDKIIEDEEYTMLWDTLETIPVEYREVLVLYYRHDDSVKQVAAFLSLTQETVRQRLSRGRNMLRDRIEQKMQAGLRNSAPDKKFTASVIAAISSIPVGVAVSEATAAASASASVPFVAALQTIMATTAVKVATVAIIAAAAIATGLILNNNEKSQPIQKTETIQPITATDSSPVEMHFNASENLSQPIATPTPQELQQSPVEQPALETTHPKESPAATEEATDTFTPRGVLSGLITDKETGEPVIDAQLHLQLPDGYYANTETDELGFYYFDEDKIKSYGNFSLTIVSTEYVGIHESLRNSININITPEINAIQHIQLDKACMVSIEAIDEENNPISNVEAIVTEITSTDISSYPLNRGYQRTDKNGKMMIGGIPSSPTPRLITLIHSEYKRIDKNHSVLANCYAPAHQTLIMNDPDVIESIKVVFKKGFEIQGEISYPYETPEKALEINAEPQWWNCSKPYSNCKINNDGTFTLKHIEPDIYEIKALVSRGGTMERYEKLITISLEEDKILNLEFPYKKASQLTNFKGKVIIEDNNPFAAQMFIRCGDNHFHQSIKTENDNKEIPFEFNDIPSGNYTVDFLNSNLKNSRFDNIHIPSDDYVFKLQLKEKINISGIILDKETQNPIKNFRVFHRVVKTQAYNKWINFPNTDNGKYQLTIREQGIHQFTIDSEYYAPQTIELDTTESTSFTVELTKGVSLLGKVLDSSGQPVHNAKVIPFSKNTDYSIDGFREKVFTTEIGAELSDIDGSFTLFNLPQGAETIQVTHPDYLSQIIDISLPLEQNTTEIILNRGCCIEGYVYDNNGNPRAHFPLIATSETRNYIRYIDAKNSKVTDKNGYYKLSKLPEKLLSITHPSASSTQGACRNLALPLEDECIQLDFGGTYFLTGRIYLNGSPLSKADLTVKDMATHMDGFMNNCRTNSDGSFNFSGIPGGTKQLLCKISDSHNLKIMQFNTNDTQCDLGDIYLDLVDFKIKVEGDQRTKIKDICLFENFEKSSSTGYSLYLDHLGTAKAENLRQGNYNIKIFFPNMARFVFNTDILKTENLRTIDIKLPIMTSSVYGKLPSDSSNFTFENKKHQYRVKTFYNQDNNEYRMDNIPAGEYIVKDRNQEEIMTFDILENQELEIDLDQYKPDLLSIADIITIDNQTRRKIEGLEIWIEYNGSKYKDAELSYIEAPPGTYTLCIRGEGYQDYRKEITLEKTQRSKIIAVMHRK
ncbi:MAG: sigma-70 family RNA polymerase sigma factor [Sedimentisphaeraceae bacterium JB056]